eukprot:TRINITY_DN239_c0_g1_i1.p1 TRINITY_DN239_c0_g1~~TRINITY_DN239_c0_g1_i1.p1  ORF type:complete len:241 (+),score=52.21 TRINITY_DN239_c0_g1_i1:879-1601(+)
MVTLEFFEKQKTDAIGIKVARFQQIVFIIVAIYILNLILQFVFAGLGGGGFLSVSNILTFLLFAFGIYASYKRNAQFLLIYFIIWIVLIALQLIAIIVTIAAIALLAPILDSPSCDLIGCGRIYGFGIFIVLWTLLILALDIYQVILAWNLRKDLLAEPQVVAVVVTPGQTEYAPPAPVYGQPQPVYVQAQPGVEYDRHSIPYAPSAYPPAPGYAAPTPNEYHTGTEQGYGDRASTEYKV